MKRIILLFNLLLLANLMYSQSYKFDFTTDKSTKDSFIKISPSAIFNEESGFGYDLQPAPQKNSTAPYFFSVNVPDGNYLIKVTIGSKDKAGHTTVRGESRRLFVENYKTKKGELIEQTFTINKRNPIISGKEKVKLKPREQKKLNWDDKLTLEFNGDAPTISYVEIERVEDVPTIFLCGNSTVVDNDNEPWASWGQMVTRFFTDDVCFANYAESGESANTFIGANRLKKILTQIKKGDYLFVEFGHNDQKQKGPGKGAFYSYMYNLKIYIDEARLKGAIPVLVTPTQRRRFNKEDKIQDSHLDYPDAMRWLAEKENIALIDLHQMTRVLYESMGVENSKNAFVHYPAGTYPGQDKELKDNSHFNTFGAYQVAKCVVKGIKDLNLPIAQFIKDDYTEFDPSQPDEFSSFKWSNSPFAEVEKPDGN